MLKLDIIKDKGMPRLTLGSVAGPSTSLASSPIGQFLVASVASVFVWTQKATLITWASQAAGMFMLSTPVEIPDWVPQQTSLILKRSNEEFVPLPFNLGTGNFLSHLPSQAPRDSSGGGNNLPPTTPLQGWTGEEVTYVSFAEPFSEAPSVIVSLPLTHTLVLATDHEFHSGSNNAPFTPTLLPEASASLPPPLGPEWNPFVDPPEDDGSAMDTGSNLPNDVNPTDQWFDLPLQPPTTNSGLFEDDSALKISTPLTGTETPDIRDPSESHKTEATTLQISVSDEVKVSPNMLPPPINPLAPVNTPAEDDLTGHASPNDGPLLRPSLGWGMRKGSQATAPMAGKITNILVKPGDVVEKGAVLATLEGEKIAHEMRAGFKGKVEAFLYSIGDMVKTGDVLFKFKKVFTPSSRASASMQANEEPLDDFGLPVSRGRQHVSSPSIPPRSISLDDMRDLQHIPG